MKCNFSFDPVANRNIPITSSEVWDYNADATFLKKLRYLSKIKFILIKNIKFIMHLNVSTI